MPTKRTRRTRRRRDERPDWARHLLETGEKPPKDTPAHSEFVGWWFFNESVPGLPDTKTAEGTRLALSATEPE